MESNWINPYDPACPRHVAKAGMPIFRLVTAVMDDLPDKPQKWIMSLALGTSNMAGMSLARLAEKTGMGELALLRAATSFCQRHGARPSPYLQAFATARIVAKGKRGAEAGIKAKDAPQGTLEGKDGQ